MEFRLDEEHELLRRNLRQIAENELAPKAAYWDETETFPWESIKKLSELGIMGLTVPEAYGGSGGDMMSFVLALEEFARVDAATAVTLLIHLGVANKCIAMYGTEEQKRRYLPPLASGEKIAAFAMTEPGAGSDALAMKTRAVDAGDHYVLNGVKHFITNGGVASTYTVLAKTDSTAGAKGISIFIVEKDFPGFSVAKEDHKMGIRGSSFAELVFDNCQVPKENLLLAAPRAFSRVMGLFNSERIGNASTCLGIAQGAFDFALRYVQERETFGHRLCENQGIQWMLADMAAQIESARLLIYRAADYIQKGLPFIKEASIAKLVANEMVVRVTNDAVQLLGGYGYTRDFPVERMMRDGKALSFGGGTPQIQRTTIAGQLLGKRIKQNWVGGEK